MKEAVFKQGSYGVTYCVLAHVSNTGHTTQCKKPKQKNHVVKITSCSKS